MKFSSGKQASLGLKSWGSNYGKVSSEELVGLSGCKVFKRWVLSMDLLMGMIFVAQSIEGDLLSSQGIPRMIFSCPQLIMWSSTLWLIPVIQMKNLVKNLISPLLVVWSMF